MDITSQAVKVLAAEIATLIRKEVDTASFNKTEIGVVTAILDNNKYSVRIKRSDYIVPANTADVYSVGDSVLVLFAQNNIKRKYIIGKA